MSNRQKEIIGLLPNLRRYVTALVNDPVAVNDIVKQALVQAMCGPNNDLDGTNIRIRLFTMMNRAAKAHFGCAAEMSKIASPAAAKSQHDEISLQYRPDDIKAALNRLPFDLRSTFLLVVLERLPYEDVSAITDVSTDTVRARLAAAREALLSKTIDLTTGSPYEAPSDRSESRAIGGSAGLRVAP